MRDLQKLGEVKQILSEIAALSPGKSVELRVPPYSAVQLIPGTTHRRGTPPATVEMAYETLIGLVNGELDWSDAIAAGLIQASGARSDLSAIFQQYRLNRITP